jgi:hypothetical protein
MSEQWPTHPQTGYMPHQAEPLAPVLVAIAPAARQSRVTVLFRWLLAIPHFIVLIALSAAALVVLVIGWFAALFTGRLPRFAADYLSGFLRWSIRVQGYTMLLTDKYPPFTLDDADYPVRVAVRPGSLNRLAVLFRSFMLIPAGIIASVLNYGAFTIMAVVTWVIVLVAGRMPDPLHQALSAVLRYYTRLIGFEYMLTSAYPDGLFGDKPIPPAFREPAWPREPRVPPQTGWSAPEPSVPPQTGWSGGPGVPPQPGWSEGPGIPPQPGFAPQAGFAGAQAGPGTGLPPVWLLVLSTAAKRLVVFYIILGALLDLGVGRLDVFNGVDGVNTLINTIAANVIRMDFQPSQNALQSYNTKIQACGQQLSCLTALDSTLSGDLTTFASQLSTVTVSGSRASQALSSLESAATGAANAFASEGNATTAAEYNAGVAALEGALGTLNTALDNAGTVLNGSSSSL